MINLAKNGLQILISIITIRPIKLTFDLVDANTNKKILSKGEKLNIIIAKKFAEKNLKGICF